MFARHQSGTRWLVAGLVFSLGQLASAQISAGGVGEPSTRTYHEMESQPSYVDWVIGSETNPVGVALDPNAGPWRKTLMGVGGGGFSADDTGYVWPNSFQLVENVVITGTRSWTDWHQSILTAGWDLGVQMQVNGGPPPQGSQVVYTPPSWPDRGGQAEWVFPALPPGTRLTFTKWLLWQGDPNVIGDLFFGVVVMDQYPTPEPATVGLLLLGGLALLRRRR